MVTKKKTVSVRAKKLSVAISEKKESIVHETDFYKWTREQSKNLREGKLDQLDIIHLIEEIESLGNSEKNAIESHMIVLFLHLLKIDHQPSMRSKFWDNSVENA